MLKRILILSSIKMSDMSIEGFQLRVKQTEEKLNKLRDLHNDILKKKRELNSILYLLVY